MHAVYRRARKYKFNNKFCGQEKECGNSPIIESKNSRFNKVWKDVPGASRIHLHVGTLQGHLFSPSPEPLTELYIDFVP